MKRVLIVSYFFPPQNAIGALRVGKLAKYLPEFGWEPWVLTLEQQAVRGLRDLPVEMDPNHVVRVGFSGMFRRLAQNRVATSNDSGPDASSRKPCRPSLRSRLWAAVSDRFRDTRLPDRAFPWCRPAIRAGNRMIAETGFDVIFSSFGPVASHYVASRLAKRYQIPWIADYRDPWSQNHIEGLRGVRRWIEAAIERHVLKPCRLITTVSEPWRRQLELLHGKPAFLVFNGFDESDYLTEAAAQSAVTGKMVINYTGTIYPGKQNPADFFRAIQELVQENAMDANALEVHFWGSKPDAVEPMAARFGVTGMVQCHGRVPHQQAIAEQWKANAQLLLECTDTNERGHYPAKIFEYLAAQRPILAVGPKGGVVDELLQTTNAGVLASDVPTVKKTLLQWMAEFRQHGRIAYQGNAEVIRRYTRCEQAKTLAQLCDRLV